MAGNGKKKGIARLLELAGQKRTLLVASAVLSTFSMLVLLVPFLAIYRVLAEFLEHASAPGRIDVALIKRWSLVTVVSLVAGFALMYAGGMASHIAAFRLLYGLRIQLTERLGNLSLGYYDHSSTGKIKKIVEHDVEKIEKFVAHQLPDVVNAAAMAFALIGGMFYLQPWLALACLLPIALGFWAQFSMMMGERSRQALRQYYDAIESISSSSIQYVRGMPSIKIFGQTVHSFRRFYLDMTQYRDFLLRYADDFRHGYVTYRVLLLSLAAFIMPVGVFLLSRDPRNVSFAAVLLLFLALSPGIAVPIFKLNGLASTLGMIAESVRRVDELLDEPELPEPARPRVPTEYTIAFERVGFCYEGTAGERIRALSDVSFVARQGEVTAIVGPSGSGKTTVAELIARFWDTQEGAITIGGADIRDIPVGKLMELLSFVFQDSFLFSDTVYNNIAMGNPGASREEVYRAAQAAQCSEFIEALPQGYETRIGQGGVYLSGGEEQRVSVARALLKNAPLLVLDEATAYADPENEHRMQRALRELMRGKTVIMIAHRLRTIRGADNIIALRQGTIAEQGRHDELLRLQGLYAGMWNAYVETSNWRIKEGGHSDGADSPNDGGQPRMVD